MSIINYCTTICATWLILNQQLLLIADACGQSSVSSIRFDQTQLNVSIGNKVFDHDMLVLLRYDEII